MDNTEKLNYTLKLILDDFFNKAEKYLKEQYDKNDQKLMQHVGNELNELIELGHSHYELNKLYRVPLQVFFILLF